MRYFLDTEFMEDGRLIEPLSLGIVSEVGSEFYVEYPHDPRRANIWVAEEVLPHLKGGIFVHSLPRIREELLNFVGDDPAPEFWAYYADYDWVVLCQTFGRMLDLPKSWPKYCRDLKQLCDDLGNPKLPVQGKGEHNAMEDARWNEKVWEFLRAKRDSQ